MGLIDSASLVVTPNSYKATKLYSIIPDNGSGDMTFARTGDTATRVNSSGLIESVTANKPRLDYTGGGCPKLLLEPQRTNLLFRSEEFDNVYWSKGRTTLTANTIVSPDGTVDADTLIDDTNASTHRIFGGSISVTSGSTYSSSFFVKAGTSSTFEIQLRSSIENDIGGTGTVFNLATGTIVSGSGTIQNYGNGWYRCTNVITANTTTTASVFMYLYNSSGQRSYVGTATNNLYIWGAQVEVGAYATSYIPTTTASVTRNVDNCYKLSSSALIGQTEGTIFVNVDLNHASFTNNGYIAQVSNSSTNRIFIYREANTNKLGAFILVGGSTIYTVKTVGSFSGIAKIAFAYKSGDSVFYVNGTQVGTSSSTYTLSVSLDKVYLDENDNLEHGSFNYNQLILFKTRLSNQELATLTTL